MLSVTVWRQIPVVVVICFLVMITFLAGEWHGFLSEMVQQSKFHLCHGKLIMCIWLSFFPWMSCIIFSQCDMLCLQHILKNLTNSCHSHGTTTKGKYCPTALLHCFTLSNITVNQNSTCIHHHIYFTSRKLDGYITETLSILWVSVIYAELNSSK